MITKSWNVLSFNTNQLMGHEIPVAKHPDISDQKKKRIVDSDQSI